MSEENKALVRRFVEEVINGRKLELADEIFAAASTSHNASSGIPRGPEAARKGVSSMQAAFPDLHATIEDMIAEGDTVAARITVRGTHGGEYQGIAPTGRPMARPGIYIVRIENGMIVESWNNSDELGLLRQLGAIPPAE